MKKWYLRIFNTARKKGDPQYSEQVLDDETLFKTIKHHMKVDVVNLETGSVCRHDYKKPLPRWCKEQLACRIVLSSGELPRNNMVDC